jgi:hypothetical protein
MLGYGKHLLLFKQLQQIFSISYGFGVKPLIQQSELRTYTKVVPFKEKSSFHLVVL